ncbi:unnamed protein product, partial [Rhizoctonia solani]
MYRSFLPVTIRADRWLPAKMNLEIIRTLQEKIVPTVFTPRGVYDGRKNLFTSRRLPLRDPGRKSQSFNVTLRPPYEIPAPRVYQVDIRLVGHVNPVTLKQYCKGQISAVNDIVPSLAPLHLALQAKPKLSLPFYARSLLTDREVRPLGGGIELWRGYFQSIRPGVSSLLLNVDISTGAMYAPGPMIQLCSQILGGQDPATLTPGIGLSDRDCLKLQRFFSRARFIVVGRTHAGGGERRPKVIHRFTTQGASSLRFTNQQGFETSVSEHFSSLGVTLSHPECICVQTSAGAVYPIELCYIIPGQLMRRSLP